MLSSIGSSATDYVIREYELDSILSQAVRKFAGQFIRKKIRLEYQPVRFRVITDEKWLLFVVEQVLSNALKYTPQGGIITIRLESPGDIMHLRYWDWHCARGFASDL